MADSADFILRMMTMFMTFPKFPRRRMTGATISHRRKWILTRRKDSSGGPYVPPRLSEVTEVFQTSASDVAAMSRVGQETNSGSSWLRRL
ncbi:hypothetical protein ACOMHN_036446 [Nucella lapillus]